MCLKEENAGIFVNHDHFVILKYEDNTSIS